jgi:hypothetical protein
MGFFVGNRVTLDKGGATLIASTDGTRYVLREQDGGRQLLRADRKPRGKKAAKADKRLRMQARAAAERKTEALRARVAEVRDGGGR